jgi:predicted N-acetyltransferase YhbS
MDIRLSSPDDESLIRGVHEAAFGPEQGPEIADLAVALLYDPTAQPLLSLFSCGGDRPTGHVLFTRVRVGQDAVPGQILAPLAVLPSLQNQGIGTRLVEHGLELLREEGCRLVFTLGDPAYYRRFGFQPAGRLGFEAPYPIPDEHADAWMVLELVEGTLGRVRGLVHCANALNDPRHWIE